MPALRPCLGTWALAVLAGNVSLTPAARAAGLAWPELQAAFEQRGFAVRLSSLPGSTSPPANGTAAPFRHPRCDEPNLFGLYLRNRKLIVICPRGNRSETLMHEGWHAIQDRCLRGAPLLSREQLLRSLNRRERREVDVYYSGSTWQREAEARVMARQPPQVYFGWVDRFCRPAAAPSPRPTSADAAVSTGAAGAAAPGAMTSPVPPGITWN